MQILRWWELQMKVWRGWRYINNFSLWVILDYFSDMFISFGTYSNFLYSQLGFGSKSHSKPSCSTSVELQGTIAGQPHQRIAPSEVLTHATQDDTRSQASESRPNRIESTGESVFMIPDLNMMPSDDCTSWDRPTLFKNYGTITLSNVQVDREHFEDSIQ